MQNVICCVPCSPLRAEATHKAEMVSQLIFGEPAHIIESGPDHWVKVVCDYDQYQGWCQESHLAGVDPQGVEHKKIRLTRKWISEIGFDGKPMHIPLGSVLPLKKNGRFILGEQVVTYKSKGWDPLAAPPNGKAIRKMALLFLNTPYLWGGKTIFGTDCSGFTQTIFRFFNVPLMRDAWQQANQGKPVRSLDQAKTGDLAFFANKEERITHVGILLHAKQIIHASGKVRIDKIDQDGIIDPVAPGRTHLLKTIRRLY